MPLIEKEVKRMHEAQIIAPIKYSDWVSNLVPTGKKTGEIRLCVDFRNLIGVLKRQLFFTKNGSHSTNGSLLFYNFIVRWIFWI